MISDIFQLTKEITLLAGGIIMNRRVNLTELMGLGSRLELYGVMAAFAVAVVILTYGALL